MKPVIRDGVERPIHRMSREKQADKLRGERTTRAHEKANRATDSESNEQKNAREVNVPNCCRRIEARRDSQMTSVATSAMPTSIHPLRCETDGAGELMACEAA